jgi:hypothetical protein
MQSNQSNYIAIRHDHPMRPEEQLQLQELIVYLVNLPTALFNQHPIIKGLHSDILGSSRCEIN